MKITVRIFNNTEEILSRVLDEGVYRVGRSDFSDIVLTGDSVSRSHLEIRVTDSAVYMTNMSSTGKVKVNGKWRETAQIADGDELTVGPYRLMIVHGVKEEAAEGAMPPVDEAGGGGAVESPPAEEGVDSGSPKVLEDAPMPDNLVALEDNRPQYQVDESLLPLEGTAALNRAETVVESKPVVAKLMFVEGPRKGEELFLEAYEVSLGRSKKADIFLDDEKLSRIHAKITRVGMGYRLIDLNSRNGTYVNGMRVLEHPLSSFDSIEIGNSKIRFLVQDIILSEQGKGGHLASSSAVVENTRSLQYDALSQGELGEVLPPGPALGPIPPVGMLFGRKKMSTLTKGILAAAVVILALVFLLPDKSDKNKVTSQAEETSGAQPPALPKGQTEVRIPPVMSKEYLELTPEMQRSVEGHYNSALRAGDQERYEEAVANLKKIHEVLPYYKQSKDLLEQYTKRLKEKQIQEAAERAKKDEKEELAYYLEEGLDYLKNGEFDKAGESFNSAINIDPNNQTAIRGIKAAEVKVRSLEQIPPDRDAEGDKKKLVKELFEKALSAFALKGYQEAIDLAEKIRQIELKGDTSYLNEAKQIIDKAHMLQKEEFEPFLIQAKEKYAEGDYNAGRDLCEEMLKRDGAYGEAKECLLKAKKALNRLAKEAYTHGYILESMNRLEEAKQYWNRAKNYVRPGDEYYDKVLKKLDYYQ
jgi:pSer/pThr/pTyr-binding forkhead associated (FHA) protein/tetratricopeptide (TPR) repeat protein